MSHRALVAVVAAVALTTLTALSWSQAANAETLSIYNNSNVDQHVEFSAAGCFGVSPWGRPLNCHSETVPPGDHVRYVFPNSTTGSTVRVTCLEPHRRLAGSSIITNSCSHQSAVAGDLFRGGETVVSQKYKIGAKWQMHQNITMADGGHIFATSNNGALYWYQNISHVGSTATMWKGGGGKQIKANWKATYKKTFGGYNGVLYAIDNGGKLYRWDYARDGSLLGSPTKIGSGWHTFTHVFGGENGVIYAIKADGALYRYKNIGKTGSTAQLWEGGGGKLIKPAPKDCMYRRAGPPCLKDNRSYFGGSGGVFYGVNDNGKVYKYTATATSASDGQKLVGDYGRYSVVFGGWRGRIYGVVK